MYGIQKYIENVNFESYRLYLRLLCGMGSSALGMNNQNPEGNIWISERRSKRRPKKIT